MAQTNMTLLNLLVCVLTRVCAVKKGDSGKKK